MTVKLTLSINEETIKRAKRISLKQGKSISKIVEEYFNSLPEKGEREDTAVDKIKKIMKGKIIYPGVDWKKTKAEHLTKKYGV